LELEFDSVLEYEALYYSDLDYKGGVVASSQVYGFAFSFLDFFAVPAGNYVSAQFNLTATSETFSGFNLVNLFAGLYNVQTSSLNVAEAQANGLSQSVAASVYAPASLAVIVMGLLGFAGLRRRA
jgi:hypothetical protein